MAKLSVGLGTQGARTPSQMKWNGKVIVRYLLWNSKSIRSEQEGMGWDNRGWCSMEAGDGG